MIKTVLTSSYDIGEQSSRIIGVTGKGLDTVHLTKAAKSSVGLFKDVDVKSESGKVVLHIVAMSAAPFYPANKNGDAFFDTNRKFETADGKSIQLGKGLKDTHKTFETDAKVFKEHFNTKNDKVYGDVLKSGYNDELNRVELLVSLPVTEWDGELSDLEKGKDLGFSMSCRLPEDMCSVCGNRAKNRSQYCNHLKDSLNQITSDGHLISAVNDDVTFFDISGVKNPADRIAFSLLKAASAHTVGGAELSEMLRIPQELISYRSKFASVLRKLAEIEKKIEAEASADDPVNSAAVSKCLSKDVVEKLASSRLSSEQILGTLAQVKVALSLPDFTRILTGPHYGEVQHLIKGAEARLPGVFSRICTSPAVQDGVIDLPYVITPSNIASLLPSIKQACSMDADCMRQRTTEAVITGSRCSIKSAAVRTDNPAEELIAQLYGQYKAAFCHKHIDDNGLTFYSVLSHYINRE